MRSRVLVSACVVAAAAVGAGWTVHGQETPAAAAPQQVTKAVWEGWMQNQNNWGRWGNADGPRIEEVNGGALDVEPFLTRDPRP